MLESSARTHFESAIWPDKKCEIMQRGIIKPIEPKEVMIEEMKA
jgi:hypothetical protein